MIFNNMAYVQVGSFDMGTNSNYIGNPDENFSEFIDARPIHKVNVGSFFLSKYEVTQAQWTALMGDNPSHFKDCYLCPVENISWPSAQRVY